MIGEVQIINKRSLRDSNHFSCRRTFRLPLSECLRIKSMMDCVSINVWRAKASNSVAKTLPIMHTRTLYALCCKVGLKHSFEVYRVTAKSGACVGVRWRALGGGCEQHWVGWCTLNTDTWLINSTEQSASRAMESHSAHCQLDFF